MEFTAQQLYTFCHAYYSQSARNLEFLLLDANTVIRHQQEHAFVHMVDVNLDFLGPRMPGDIAKGFLNDTKTT